MGSRGVERRPSPATLGANPGGGNGLPATSYRGRRSSPSSPVESCRTPQGWRRRCHLPFRRVTPSSAPGRSSSSF
eukprot:13343543-Alexandrium_andersonii.AAC.1